LSRRNPVTMPGTVRDYVSKFTANRREWRLKLARRLRGPLVFGITALAAAAACSLEPSFSIDKDEVTRAISDQYEGNTGHAPQSVSCPGDLKGEVGTTMRCTLADGGNTFGVEVKVNKVEGINVNFDILLDDKPQ
jgi:Domain of unknown function (DUF4333)